MSGYSGPLSGGFGLSTEPLLYRPLPFDSRSGPLSGTSGLSGHSGKSGRSLRTANQSYIYARTVFSLLLIFSTRVSLSTTSARRRLPLSGEFRPVSLHGINPLCIPPRLGTDSSVSFVRSLEVLPYFSVLGFFVPISNLGLYFRFLLVKTPAFYL